MPIIKNITTMFETDFGVLSIDWDMKYSIERDQFNCLQREDEVSKINCIMFLETKINLVLGLFKDKELTEKIENMLLDRVQYVSTPDIK